MEAMGLMARMTEDEGRVWRVLEPCIGKERGLTSLTISVMLDLRRPYVRKLIRNLIVVHGIVIVGDVHDGYYRPRVASELDDALRVLWHRAMEILRRYARLKRVSVDSVTSLLREQLTLWEQDKVDGFTKT